MGPWAPSRPGAPLGVRPPLPKPGRGRGLTGTGVLGLGLIAALGFVGYTFLAGSPHAASSPPAAAKHAVAHTGRSSTLPGPGPSRAGPSPHPTVPARRPMRPTAIVRAYVAAINGHHYARAW